MARGAMTLEEFLGHSTRSGGGAQFLRKWKDRKPPAVNTLFHTRAPFIALWQHGLPRVQVIDKDGEATRREVWGGSWNCLEDEAVLKSQYFRDRDGRRKSPPSYCPMCLMTEYVRQLVADGDIKLTTPVFRWEGDDADKARVVTAGGLYGGFGNNMSEEDKREVRKAGISLKEAWKENMMAKCNYLFVVADVDDPGAGVQVAIETTLLGDKVREVIRDQMTALGDEEGNPMRNPYAIRWEYREAEKEFSKKYKAIAMPKLPITPELLDLVVEQDPPDVTRIAAPGDVGQLRTALEEHALIELPWDDFFREAEREQADQDDRPSTAGRAPARAPTPAPKAAPKPAAAPPKAAPKPAAAAPKAAPKPATPVPADAVACDKCGGAMRLDQYTCPHCGVSYDPDTGQLLKDKPKPMSRSEAASRAALVAPGGTQRGLGGGGGAGLAAAVNRAAESNGGQGVPPEGGSDGWPDGDEGGAPDDDIPF